MPCGAGWHGPHDREDFFLHVRNLHLWGCCRMRARLISRDAGGGAARVQSADGAFGLPRSCRWRHRHTGKGGASHDARRQAEHATARHTMQTFRDHDFSDAAPGGMVAESSTRKTDVTTLANRQPRPAATRQATARWRDETGKACPRISGDRHHPARRRVGRLACPCRVRLGARAPPGPPPVRRPAPRSPPCPAVARSR
jgi:hypothetical protein